MGINSEGEPSPDDGFIMRMCHGLDLKPWQLAKVIGIPYKELKPLLNDQRWQLAEMTKDDTLWKIMDYTTVRLGQIMAIRHELNVKLQRDRARQAAHLARFKARDAKSPPRS